MQNVCEILQVKHLKTTAYRPQTNGALERFHRTLKDLLSHYIQPDQRDWDEWVPFALAAYSSMTHSSTGDSPVFLLFGRDMDYPYEEIFKPLRVRYDTDSNYVAEFMQRMKIAHRNAIQNMEKNTEKVHNQCNKTSASPTFSIGDRVYLYDPSDKVGLSSKLAKKWTGPYRITELRGVNAQIEEIHGSRIQKVHVNRLKPCLATDAAIDQLGNMPVKYRSVNRDEQTGDYGPRRGRSANKSLTDITVGAPRGSSASTTKELFTENKLETAISTPR